VSRELVKSVFLVQWVKIQDRLLTLFTLISVKYKY